MRQRISGLQSSSVFQNNREASGPNKVTDRLFSSPLQAGIFKTNIETYPWIQITFLNSVTVTRLLILHGGIVNRNLFVYVGPESQKMQQQSSNPECALISGSIESNSINDIACNQPLRGQHLVIQMKETGQLQIAEVFVFSDSSTGNFS